MRRGFPAEVTVSGQGAPVLPGVGVSSLRKGAREGAVERRRGRHVGSWRPAPASRPPAAAGAAPTEEGAGARRGPACVCVFLRVRRAPAPRALLSGLSSVTSDCSRRRRWCKQRPWRTREVPPAGVRERRSSRSPASSLCGAVSCVWFLLLEDHAESFASEERAEPVSHRAAPRHHMLAR